MHPFQAQLNFQNQNSCICLVYYRCIFILRLVTRRNAVRYDKASTYEVIDVIALLK